MGSAVRGLRESARLRYASISASSCASKASRLGAVSLGARWRASILANLELICESPLLRVTLVSY
jgi:hypothetical protein